MFSKGKKTSNGSAGATALPSNGSAPAGSGLNGGAAPRRPSGGVPSIISADLTIEGNLISHGDVQIDGTVDGNIRSRTLTLGEHAQVKGAVEAETVRICGTIEGEVRAKSVVLTKTARVTGDVVHESLAVEAGAYIDGHCRRDIADGKPLRALEGEAAEPTPTATSKGKAAAIDGESKAAS